MNAEQHFDMLILGGGPGGAKAALRAAAKGMKTALVEAGFLGGACLNVGCIPTKFLLGATASLPLFAIQRKYKTAEGEARFDLCAMQTRKERYIEGSRRTLEKELLAQGVTLFHGKGAFTSQNGLAVSGKEKTELSFGACVVATGSLPASFPGLKPDGACVLSSASLLNLKTPPESLIIVGGGAIGLELGELFHRLGTRIILAEVMPRILPGEDEDVSEAARTFFTRAGWQVHTGRRIASLSTLDGQACLRFEDGETFFAATALLAVGRTPATTALDADKAKLNLNAKGWLATDEHLRCAEHVYAVGDVNGRTLLAHAADHQARYAIDHACGATAAPYAPPPMPACVYGSMEIMRVGPTETELRRAGVAFSRSQAPLAANAIAQSYGHTHGFVKMLWVDDTLRAVCAAGHGVSHLVTAAALLVQTGVKKNLPLPVIFAHPTLDEALESAIVAPRQNI